MSRREQDSAGSSPVATRLRTRRAGHENDAERLQSARDEVRSLSLDTPSSETAPRSSPDAPPQGRAPHSMTFDSARAMAHPYRNPGRPAQERDARNLRGRPQQPEFDESQQYVRYTRNGGNPPPEEWASYYNGPPQQERRYRSSRIPGDANAFAAQAWPENGKQDQDNTDTSRDPSTDNGDSSGNSLETQQWSDSETNNTRPSTASATETSAESQGDASCRVSWCEHTGKRYGLCWAHGGVKKCCQRNCPKVALDTGEFCSIHEREVSANTF